jgi:amino-acid N-acetyltransferase
VATVTPPWRDAPREFGEKSFYLDEFRARTLCVSAYLAECERELRALGEVLGELARNDTRVILLLGISHSADPAAWSRRLRRRLGRILPAEQKTSWFRLARGRRRLGQSIVDLTAAKRAADMQDVLTRVWTVLRHRPLLVALVGEDELIDIARRVAARLRVHKLVIAEDAGGISSPSADQMSFMDEEMLNTILRAGEAEWAGLAARRATLAAVRAALQQGVRTVNLCRIGGLERELFTYEGSGTLFTREDYCKVERLGIDDFEEVERLLVRGQNEGYLKPRSEEETARILLNGFGATIGTHHLAGVCALETEAYAAERAGEIVGLYTITRFKSEGVGSRLLDRALLEARELGLGYVFACTIEPRAQAFFERHGFRDVGMDEVPAAKWKGYDRRRLGRLKVYRLDIDSQNGTEE